MDRKTFLKIISDNKIQFKKIIGITNSFDIEVEKNQALNRDIFPKHRGECYTFMFDKDLYTFEF